MKKIKVVELFAGVGGFRIGLSNASDIYEVVWSNQWEPSTKKQDASDIYIKRFGPKNHSNEDIASIPTGKIPEHNLLVGGFPCQDYSVARTLSQAEGIQGKKGVLWWEIHRIIKESKHMPEFLLLENVDRLLKSPASQRGKDFAIILASLSDLGYAVEWRIINAADYGMPQRRRRVFIMGYHKKTNHHSMLHKTEPKKWITNSGILADAFYVNAENSEKSKKFEIKGTLPEITEHFNKEGTTSPFENSGIMVDRKVYTIKTCPSFNGHKTTLSQILLPESKVPETFFINDSLDRWKYLKGSKNEKRYNKKKDFYYKYGEGSMVFPDNLDAPSRTIVTGEGGASPSRFKHVVKTESNRFRRLTPIELERLNMFPDNHTEGCSDIKRAFLMGNALVTGVVEKIGRSLAESFEKKFI